MMSGESARNRHNVNLSTVRWCWSLLFLTALTATLITSGPQVSNPLASGDRISSYILHNHQQCLRLCWYVSTCVRLSYYSHDYTPGELAVGGTAGGDDNCVLHATAGNGLVMPEGWTEEPASGHSLPPSHGCLSRHCGDTEVCMPVVYRDKTSVCASLPGYNDCASSPCQNGGRCVDQVDNYTCNCAAGYTGRNCQTDKDDCDPSPCVNAGICEDLVNNYTCNCSAGYTGRDCQTDIDDCDPSPCVNAGICEDLVNNYTCNCSAGYTGRDCQTAICMSRDCEEDADCPLAGTACYSGQCLCSGGYYFSQSQAACVKECAPSAFHETCYAKYKDYDFYDYDRDMEMRSVQGCKDWCHEKSYCRLFVMYMGKCHLKEYTSQHNPNNFREQATVDTYQRTCV